MSVDARDRLSADRPRFQFPSHNLYERGDSESRREPPNTISQGQGVAGISNLPLREGSCPPRFNPNIYRPILNGDRSKRNFTPTVNRTESWSPPLPAPVFGQPKDAVTFGQQTFRAPSDAHQAKPQSDYRPPTFQQETQRPEAFFPRVLPSQPAVALPQAPVEMSLSRKTASIRQSAADMANVDGREVACQRSSQKTLDTRFSDHASTKAPVPAVHTFAPSAVSFHLGRFG